MNKSLYLSDFRCRCKEELSIKKRRKVTKRKVTIRPEKSFLYPDSNELTSKTFNLKSERKLSSIAKLLLNSFQSKYLYYAIDDIIYFLNLHPSEQDNLLAILYSPVISLQNNFSINFFDIWIHEIYINEISKMNKFLNNNSQNLESCSYITIKLLYKTSRPIKKEESLW